eukprot:354174-Chlamydomonas_euryale.AAC.1
MVRRMQHDLEGVVPHIQEPKALKEAIKQVRSGSGSGASGAGWRCEAEEGGGGEATVQGHVDAGLATRERHVGSQS